MRPVYERQRDRDKEAQVASALREKWNVYCVMLPPFASADMLILDRRWRPRCWAEIKSRNIAFGTYDHLHLSLDKVRRLQTLQDITKIKAIIIANLKDGIFWQIVPSAESTTTDVGGRTDRGDAKDIEPMACLFWRDFARIS